MKNIASKVKECLNTYQRKQLTITPTASFHIFNFNRSMTNVCIKFLPEKKLRNTFILSSQIKNANKKRPTKFFNSITQKSKFCRSSFEPLQLFQKL